MDEKPRFDTVAVHAGTLEIPVNAPSSPPIFQASSYAFSDLDEVEAVYGGVRPGAVYGRYGGPNAHHFEAAVAEFEGAEAAAATASGMAAIDAALATNLTPGGRIVASRELYGGTFALLEKDYQERGFQVDFVDQTDLAAVEAALARRASVLYVEALTNPLIRVADLPRLAEIAHRAGSLLVVDATFATPVLVRPLAHGADLVAHSVGKYIGGHGDVGAGILSGRRELVDRARAYSVRRGSPIPHLDAWLALRGVRTLALRMHRHTENARAAASYLATAGGVERVHHPSLPAHPDHALAQRLYPEGTGGMLSFDLRGGREAVDRFLRELRTIAIVHSLGEVATTISYSAASSHRPLPHDVRRSLGVTDGTLRLSVGIEDPCDIIADLERAFTGLYARVHA